MTPESESPENESPPEGESKSESSAVDSGITEDIAPVDPEGHVEGVTATPVPGVPDFPMPGIPEAVIATSEFRGPLPSPQHLREYEEILPGFAERLLAKYEVQAEHRQKMEKTAMRAEVAALFTGQVFAFALMGAALVFGYLLVDNGHALWGAGAFAAGIAPVAIHFLRRPKEDDDAHEE